MSALGVGDHMCLHCSACVCSDVRGPQCPWQNPGRAIVRFHVVQTCFLLKQAKSSGWYHAALLLVVSHNAAQGWSPLCAISSADGWAGLLVYLAAYSRPQAFTHLLYQQPFWDKVFKSSAASATWNLPLELKGVEFSSCICCIHSGCCSSCQTSGA